MAITLSRLYENAGKSYGMKLVAGSAKMESFVRWVHMIEDKDVASFVHGFELIFTTGIAQAGVDWLLEFAKTLYARKVAGLVVNIGPYVSTLPQNLIDYCEAIGLPLFTVPWEVHLIDITYDFCHRIVASEEIELGLATALKNLIFEPEEEKYYRSTLEKRGFKSSNRYAVVAMEPNFFVPESDETQTRNLRLHAHRLLNKFGKRFGLFFHDRKMFLILQEFTQEEVVAFTDELQTLYSGMQESYRFFFGISPGASDYEAIGDGYRKADAALKVGRIQGKQRMHYEDIGMYKLIFSVERFQALEELYKEILGPLEAHDIENGTDYVETLRIYLDCDCSVQEVAAKTFVHRNTVNYKIKRIGSILDIELNQENRMKFMIAFYIKDLL
ncbi:MAG: hypothetical protein PWQ12_397 [Clostridiales bacterium]|jgi:predicted DNA-binding protein YlxM (UPF0122 family)|nr:hypothetical protein [Clostridiales bacterium]